MKMRCSFAFLLLAACEPQVAAVLPPDAQDGGKLAGSGYAATVQSTPGLVAYFRFSEPSGTTAVDRIAGYRMTADPGATFAGSGAIPSDPEPGNASFDAAQPARFSMPFPDQFASLQRGLTIEFWLRLHGKQTTGGCAQPSLPGAKIIWVEGSTTPDDCAWGLVTAGANSDELAFLLQLDADDGPYRIGRATTAAQTLERASDSACDDGVWQHIAATFDASASRDQMKIYVAGARSATLDDAHSGNVAPILPDRGIAGFDVNPSFDVGGTGLAEDVDLVSLGSPLDGELDELAIYSRALSDAEIAQHAEFGAR